jgi:hypothetical protein
MAVTILPNGRILFSSVDFRFFSTARIQSMLLDSKARALMDPIPNATNCLFLGKNQTERSTKE